MSFSPPDPSTDPVLDADTFNYQYHNYSEEPTNATQPPLPLVPNHYSEYVRRPANSDGSNRFTHSSFTHHDHLPILLMEYPEFHSLQADHPLEMTNPSYPNYPNQLFGESTVQNAVSPSSFANEGLQHISSAVPPYPHQADGTTPVALSSHSSSVLPHSSAPLTTQTLPEPTNVALEAMSTFNQAQDQIPPSTSTTFDEFGGSVTTHPALPAPPATASLAMDPLDAVYTCQCVTDGSPCNAAVGGSVPAVRDHLKRDHAFRSVGKKGVVCPWVGCSRTLQRESIPRHIVTCHFRVRVLCIECGLTLSRRDVQSSHAKACRGRRRTASRLDCNESSAG